MIVGLNNVHDFYNIGVVDHLQDLYLSSHCLLSLWVADLHLFIGLYRDLSVLRLEDGHSNRCVCALADHLAHHVILLELHSQVRGIREKLSIFFETTGKGQPGQHLIVLIFNLKKPDGCEIPAYGGKSML